MPNAPWTALLRGSLLASASLAAACALPPQTVTPSGAVSATTRYSSPKYADPKQWLCRPDLPESRCHAELGATEIHPDHSRSPAPHVAAAPAKVDCFYVYPTVDLGLVPGNHTDFTDLAPMTAATLAQAARFGEVCDVYVPLYRQITIGTYLFGAQGREERLAVAFSDVADAFAHYLGQHNHGRKIVLIGHSQGAEMVVRLLQRFFDGDPALRERLLVAMAIGGRVDVPKGKLVGGTFTSVPVCSTPDELGCVIAYRSYRAGGKVSTALGAPPAGSESVCVNPGSVDRNERRPLSRAYFPTVGRSGEALLGTEGVTTPFVLFRDLYAAQCLDGPEGSRYLGISAPPGAPGPIDLTAARLNTALGLHVLDLQLPQGDLIDLVKRRAAALP
jgi:Protein of unknown function (DUF3089)